MSGTKNHGFFLMLGSFYPDYCMASSTAHWFADVGEREQEQFHSR
jgi:hypothetical protein